VQTEEDTLAMSVVAYEDAPAPDNGRAVQLVTPPDWLRRQTTPRVVVDNLRALVEAVARHEVPLEVLAPHTPTLNKIARQRGGLFSIDGCRVVLDITVITIQPTEDIRAI